MSKKNIVISIYFAIAVLFAIYGTFWGANAYRGFAYNLGGAIFWPTILFPALGKEIGSVVIVVGIIAVLVFVKGKS